MGDTAKLGYGYCIRCHCEHATGHHMQEVEVLMGERVGIAELVIADVEGRAKLGEKKYGERLQTFNGRSALQDAYEEALDLAMYLRQKIEEDNRRKPLPR